MKSAVSFAAKSILTVGVALVAIGNAAANPIPATKNQAQVMKLTGIGNNAKGTQRGIIDAAMERIAKAPNPRICPIFKDSELEALIFDANDSRVLMGRYSEKSSEASTLGQYTNMSVMKDCEKQARRILFFWDSHSYDLAQKRYGNLAISSSKPIVPVAASAKEQPKTANDCQVEHMKRVEGIRAFSSGESMERQLHESVKTWQSCGEQALQDRMKK